MNDPRCVALATQVDALEAELRRLRWWQDAPIEPERMNFRRAFGADTMAFSQWLQLVFVPTARSMIAGARPLPSSSQLAAYAVREFDGQNEAAGVCDLLRLIDAAIEGR